MARMRKAGIREARQQLTNLLEEVRHGVEIVITDRGRPVARLVPYSAESPKPFPDRSEFRSSMPRLERPLSRSIIEAREDRL